MKSPISLSLLILASALTLGACGSKSNDSETIVVGEADTEIEPVNYQSGTDRLSPEQLDELIWTPDDLTSGQVVGALDYLRTIIEETGGRKRDENRRKFVDLYGIALDIHSDNMRSSIERLKTRSGIDLRAVYDDYVNILNVGDENAVGADEISETIDTIRTVNADSTEVASATSTQTSDVTITTVN